jgi:imidazolonepropionase
MTVLIRNARVVTMQPEDQGGTAEAASTPRRGRAMRHLGVLPRADVLVEHGAIAAVGVVDSAAAGVEEIDAHGRVLMPGFIDCHTHACFAGDRLDEWERKLSGATYQEIMAAGGGIMSSVRATRAASGDELASLLRERGRRFLALGTTTLEVKSGYGLSTRDELKMLRACRAAASDSPFALPKIVPTALLGHAIPAEAAADAAGFVDGTLHETLDAVHAEFPGVAVDAFCEKGAWTLEQCVALFTRALSLGHPIRVHADQFTSLGMVRTAVELKARSVDHLEASTPEDLERLAKSGTIGVLLPNCGFHLDGRYAAGRSLIDAGGAAAIATNFNPGSAPCMSMAMTIALAVRHCGLTAAEAICACTVNTAAVLGMHDRGVIAPGMRADLILLQHRDERALAYEFGGTPIETVILNGRIVQRA